MRIAFMGTPDFAVPSLRALVAAGHEVVAVYTQPPRPANRGKQLSPSIIQTVAQELGLAVFSPDSLRDPRAQADFAALSLDIAVVAAYGLILPQAILDAPKFGCLNVHGSLLPRWRGAAPVQRAILAGDQETGVEIMQMAAGLDTGDIRASARTSVDRKSTGELTTELAAMGAQLMVDVLADLSAFPAVPQPSEGMTYAAKIDKAETRIDFTQSAQQVERHIRAFKPAPGAWFEYAGERYRILAADIVKELRHSREGGNPSPDVSSIQDRSAMPKAQAMDSRLRGNDELLLGVAGTILDDILTIACGEGAIRPIIIQRAGKPPLPVDEFLRGKAMPTGTRLS